MASIFDSVSKINSEKESWRLKVRIVRLWSLPSFNNPRLPNSLEMVLIDEVGDKIHASVRKTLVYKFNPLLVEGSVYAMTYFGVGVSSGYFRTTKHEYRLNFQLRTSVKTMTDSTIPLYGFSFTPFDEIFSKDSDVPHLVDVMGKLTGVGTEKEHDKDGKKTKMNVIELDMDGIKIECALFGNYVDELNSFLATGDNSNAVVIIKFAKIKTFKGKIVLQNVMYATRLLFNSDVQEVVDFRKRLSECPEVSSQGLSQLTDHSPYSIEDDFLRFTARKTIEQLKDCKEENCCIILATIKHIVRGDDWWYTACKCNKSVYPDSGMYYCDACYSHVLTVFPRYRIKVRVIDETDSATFVIFDRDATTLLNKSCSDMIEHMQQNGDMLSTPTAIEDWVDKTFIFKVEVKSATLSQFEPSFRVKRVSDDSSLIQKFKDTTTSILEIDTPSASLGGEIGPSLIGPGNCTIEKDLMLEFSENAADLDTICNVTPAKRTLDTELDQSPGEMSSNKSVAIKQEKD